MPEVQAEIRTMPSKIFFVDMLVRDLGLIDAILDLVDNSMDKLISRIGLDPTTAVVDDQQTEKRDDAIIHIHCDQDKFVIEDVSGGMSREDITSRVFVLGNPKAISDTPGLSVYGIGMKRAFFKIGRYVEVLTNSEVDGQLAVVWNIDEWKTVEEWALAFSDISEVTVQRELPGYGTAIQVTGLHPDIAETFNRLSFRNDLLSRLSAAYAGFIRTGVTIKLITKSEQGTHTDEVESVIPKFGTSEEVNIAKKTTTFKNVDISIYTGITPWSDRIPRGCYVFCNGRMVLQSNVDRLTGWGVDGHPVFRPKYNHFLCFIFFQSDDLLALPWQTTKQGVNSESAVYQHAINEMKLLARPVLSFLDSRYDSDVDLSVEREALKDLQPVPLKTSIQDVAFEFKSKKPAGPRMVSIVYRKTEDEVNQAKELFGDKNMSNKSVGERTFDYFVEHEEQ